MKILHVIDSGGLYGAEMMLVSLATEQLKMGAHPVIGSIRTPGLSEKPIEKEARSRGIEVHEFSMRPGVNLPGACRILQYVHKGHFDIIHSHGYKTNILLGLMPSFLRGCPIITTLHGWTSAGGWTKMRVNEELDAFSLRFVDRIVLVNEGMLFNKKVQNLPKDKIRTIDNGIEIECVLSIGQCHLDASQKTELDNFCTQGIIIASIGRLSHEKGFTYLLEAVKLLRDKMGKDVRLLLIGDGQQRDNLLQQARKLGIQKYFYITGYVQNGRRLLELVDYYVISSLTEGLPITLLEAMASGTPIVATEVGGIPHVVKHGQEALLVPPGMPRAIAEAVYEFVQDTELAASLVARAGRKVRAQYGSAVMAAKYRDLYTEVLCLGK